MDKNEKKSCPASPLPSAALNPFKVLEDLELKRDRKFFRYEQYMGGKDTEQDVLPVADGGDVNREGQNAVPFDGLRPSVPRMDGIGDRADGKLQKFGISELLEENKVLKEAMSVLERKHAELEAKELLIQRQKKMLEKEARNVFDSKKGEILDNVNPGRSGRRGGESDVIKELQDSIERLQSDFSVLHKKVSKLSGIGITRQINDVGTHTETLMPILCSDHEGGGDRNTSKTMIDFSKTYNGRFNMDTDFETWLHLFLKAVSCFPLMTESEFTACITRALGPKALAEVPVEVFSWKPNDLLYFIISTFGKATSRMRKLNAFLAYKGEDAHDVKEMIKNLSNLAKGAQVDNDQFIERFMDIVPGHVQQYFSPFLKDLFRKNEGCFPKDLSPLLFIMKKLDQQPSFNVKL